MARHLIKADVIIRNTKPADKTLRLSDGDGLYLVVPEKLLLEHAIFGSQSNFSTA